MKRSPWGEHWRWGWWRGAFGLSLTVVVLVLNWWRGDVGTGLAIASALSSVGWVRRGHPAA